MSARFDLEQNILDCWKITDDIDLLFSNVMGCGRNMSRDEIANALLGLKTLYNMRFEKAWESFEQTLEEMREVKNASV